MTITEIRKSLKTTNYCLTDADIRCPPSTEFGWKWEITTHENPEKILVKSFTVWSEKPSNDTPIISVFSRIDIDILLKRYKLT